MDNFTTDKPEWCPNRRVFPIPPWYKFKPLQGYAYTLAAIDSLGNCVGWVFSEDLGFRTVDDWTANNG